MASLNINGKLWSNSDNIGKQLIQKLGWAEGEGLGKNKQGTKSHVKVSLKNDRDGVGMKSDKFSHNSGLLQTFDYDMLLKSKCAEIKSAKTEETVQRMSRGRFGRAVRQEYFNPLNDDDWTKILGKSIDTNKDANIKIESVINTNSNNDISPNCTELDTKFITKKMNVNEYFETQMKIKMSKIKAAQDGSSVGLSEYNINKRVVPDNENESDSPKKKRSKLSNICDKEDPEVKISEKKIKKERKSDVEVEQIIEVMKKNSKKKSVQNSESSLDQKLAESEIKLTNVEALLANEPMKVKKKRSKLFVEAMKPSNNEKKKINETIMVTEFVSELKSEPLTKTASVKLEELKTIVFSSPLDSSNIRDIKGYKYY